MEDFICKKRLGFLYKILCFFETQIDLSNNKRKWLFTILLNFVVVLFNSLTVSVLIYFVLLFVISYISKIPNSAVNETSYFDIFPNILIIIIITNFAVYIQNLYSNKYNSARNMKLRIFTFINKFNEKSYIKFILSYVIYTLVVVYVTTQLFKLLDKVIDSDIVSNKSILVLFTIALVVVSMTFYFVYVFGPTNELIRSSRKLKFTTFAAVIIIGISMFELDIDISNLTNAASYKELFKIFLILLSSVVWFDSIYSNYELYVNHHTDMYREYECEHCQYCEIKWFKFKDLKYPFSMKIVKFELMMSKYKQLSLLRKLKLISVLLVSIMLWYYITKFMNGERVLIGLNDFFVKILMATGLSNADSKLLLTNYYDKLGYLVFGVLMIRFLATITVNMFISLKSDSRKLKSMYNSRPIIKKISALVTNEALNIVQIIIIIMVIIVFPVLLVLAGVKIQLVHIVLTLIMVLSIIEVIILLLLIVKANLNEYRKS